MIEIRSGDWFPYNQRGYLYFRAQRYDEARADIEKSIALQPETEWPYMWGMLIALRQGRLEDASTYMTDILNNPAKNPTFIEYLMTSIFGGQNATLLGTSMKTIEQFMFGQFDVSIQEADTVLRAEPSYAEMYLIKGLSYCNLDEYQKAEEAYSAGLAVDSSFTLLNFLRAEMRYKLGNETGVMEDFAVVQNSDISGNLNPYLQAGQFSCKNLIASK